MASLWGKEYSRRELAAHIGRIEQVAGFDKYEIVDGPGRGMRVIALRTGSGLRLEILPDRGLDIGRTEVYGIPLTWMGSPGQVAPSFYEPSGAGWGRGFGGGLLVTCGLTQVGSPCTDGGESLGLHGRASYIPAESWACYEEWDGEECDFMIWGRIRETKVMGENVVLERSIRARMGELALSIADTVTNEGSVPVPHMLLYHMNFGYPLIGPEARLIIPGEAPGSGRPSGKCSHPGGHVVIPRDEDAASGVNEWDRCSEPRPGFREQVFYHKLSPDRGGWGEVCLVNPGFPVAGGHKRVELRIRWDMATLPNLIQWKMMDAGNYVLGLEPANCLVEGRVKERERGTLVTLSPGESRNYRVNIEIALE